jgi:hypothetical protein
MSTDLITRGKMLITSEYGRKKLYSLLIKILTKNIGTVGEVISFIYNELANESISIEDKILLENFQHFLIKFNQPNNRTTMDIQTQSIELLAVHLAKASPNYESGYQGEPEKLREYAKRIIKLINDCVTLQKSEYLANIARAVIHHEIDANLFFKLGKCITNLTEEDLEFIKVNIRENEIYYNDYFIEDFLAVGLLYEVDGGYTYSPRAFELGRYALYYNYDKRIEIPKKFPPRHQALFVGNKQQINKV